MSALAPLASLPVSLFAVAAALAQPTPQLATAQSAPPQSATPQSAPPQTASALPLPPRVAPVPLLPPTANAPTPPASATMPPITAAPNPGTATVTSDSSEYCQHLSGRVDGLARDAKPPPPAEVAGLAREGQRLCEDGKTRSGILHLRRAFIMLRHPDAER